MEKDDEVKGSGNWLQFGDFGYDPRIIRRNNTDPVRKSYISPYATFGNNPIYYADPSGYDWFANGDSRAWSESTNSTEQFYGQTWNNIGSEYTSTSTLGNTTTVIKYQQNVAVDISTFESDPITVTKPGLTMDNLNNPNSTIGITGQQYSAGETTPFDYVSNGVGIGAYYFENQSSYNPYIQYNTIQKHTMVEQNKIIFVLDK